MKKFAFGIVVFLLLVVIFRRPLRSFLWWAAVEVVCDGHDNSDLQQMDDRLARKVLPIMEQLKEEGYRFLIV